MGITKPLIRKKTATPSIPRDILMSARITAAW
jgi:hypothetical protein